MFCSLFNPAHEGSSRARKRKPHGLGWAGRAAGGLGRPRVDARPSYARARGTIGEPARGPCPGAPHHVSRYDFLVTPEFTHHFRFRSPGGTPVEPYLRSTSFCVETAPFILSLTQ